ARTSQHRTFAAVALVIPATAAPSTDPPIPRHIGARGPTLPPRRIITSLWVPNFFHRHIGCDVGRRARLRRRTFRGGLAREGQLEAAPARARGVEHGVAAELPGEGSADRETHAEALGALLMAGALGLVELAEQVRGVVGGDARAGVGHADDGRAVGG